MNVSRHEPSPIEFNIYADESCHLENDLHRIMVLGALICPKSEVKGINQDIQAIVSKYHSGKTFEVKWVKVSPARQEMYEELINYFFQQESLRFRALIVPDKSLLNHQAFQQTHDEWYHKMYFLLLRQMITPNGRYFIYPDYKDTWSYKRFSHLKRVLSNSQYDMNETIIPKLQPVRSHEVRLLQLTDLLTGAVSYANRGLSSSPAKSYLVKQIQTQTGLSLVESTRKTVFKFNLFVWDANRAE